MFSDCALTKRSAHSPGSVSFKTTAHSPVPWDEVAFHFKRPRIQAFHFKRILNDFTPIVALAMHVCRLEARTFRFERPRI